MLGLFFAVDSGRRSQEKNSIPEFIPLQGSNKIIGSDGNMQNLHRHREIGVLRTSVVLFDFRSWLWI